MAISTKGISVLAEEGALIVVASNLVMQEQLEKDLQAIQESARQVLEGQLPKIKFELRQDPSLSQQPLYMHDAEKYRYFEQEAPVFKKLVDKLKLKL